MGSANPPSTKFNDPPSLPARLEFMATHKSCRTARALFASHRVAGPTWVNPTNIVLAEEKLSKGKFKPD